MKNTISILILSLVILFSCKPETILENSNEEKSFVEYTKKGDRIGNMVLPEGTKVYKKEISHGQEFIFELPENMELITKDELGNFSVFGDVSYTCTCSGTGGCNVIKIQNEYGCMQGLCVGSCTGKHNPGPVNFDFSKENHIFLNKTLGIDFLKKKDNPESYHVAPALLFEIAELSTFVNELQLGFDQGKAKGEETEILFINAYDYVFGIEVLKSYTKKNLSTENVLSVMSTETVSCLCNSEEDGCDLGSSGPFIICDAGFCAVCTMTVTEDSSE